MCERCTAGPGLGCGGKPCSRCNLCLLVCLPAYLCVRACRVWRLAVPLMINNIAGYALSIVGAIYIGRLGALPLSASVLANSLYNCTGLSLALGLSAGMETLCGQVSSQRPVDMRLAPLRLNLLPCQ